MAVKRVIVGSIFVVLMLTSYLYLSNKYNLHTVEYGFAGDLSYKQLVSLRESTKSLVKSSSVNKELICVINYIGSFKGNRLIMTTGFDNLVSHLPIREGRFIGDCQVREATIGDKAADRLYRSMNVVGETIRVNNQQYKIIGVIKNSDTIYITFDESSNIRWSKKNIKFIVEDQKYLNLYTEMLEGKLRTLNLEILEKVIYKQEAYLYINSMIFVFVLLLIKATRKQFNKAIRNSKEIFADYKEQSRRIEIIEYSKKHIKDILHIAKELFSVAIFLAATIKCIVFLQIPLTTMPSNLFALSSYVEVIKLNADNYFNRLDYGISGLTRDIHIINLFILLALIGAQFYMNKDRHYQEKSRNYND